MSFELAATLKGHSQAVTAVRFSLDGSLLLSGSADRSVCTWRLDTGALAHSCTGHTQGVADVAWTHDPRVAVSGSDDGAVRFWDVERGAALGGPLEGHLNYVYCVDASARTDLAVSGSFDESMRFWDSRVSKCVRVVPCHSEPVTSVAFSADGTYVVSGGADGLVRFWDTASGQCLKTLHADGAPPVTHVRPSPNGRFLLVSTLDGCARLWDILEGRVAKTYTAGHATLGVSACFALAAGGGQLVIVGSEDASATGGPACFDAQSRRVVQRLAGGSGAPELAVASAADLRCVAAASTLGDCAIRLWRS